jgi:hypothetical protein
VEFNERQWKQKHRKTSESPAGAEATGINFMDKLATAGGVSKRRNASNSGHTRNIMDKKQKQGSW